MVVGTGLGRTFGLYFATAIVELLGCYLPLLWLSGIWLLASATPSLIVRAALFDKIGQLTCFSP